MMYLPREHDSSSVSQVGSFLAAEKLLRDLGCEAVSIGKIGGLWGLQTRDFPSGRLLVCDAREAFAMRIRHSKTHSVAIVPLQDGGSLVHQGRAIPDGCVGFSLPGMTQIVHARSATRFAVLWMEHQVSKTRTTSMILRKSDGEHLGRTLEGLFQNAAADLGRFVETLSAIATRALAQDALEIVGSNPRRLVNRMAFVETLWDFILDKLDQDLELGLLQGKTGKSSRTLEYAFTEIVGRTPIGFIKALRMKLARQMLLEGRGTCVRDIAAACGLWHFGRFSIDYRLQFGELPSKTLRSSKSDAQKVPPAGG